VTRKYESMAFQWDELDAREYYVYIIKHPRDEHSWIMRSC